VGQTMFVIILLLIMAHTYPRIYLALFLVSAIL
jgi:hypothetical protein